MKKVTLFIKKICKIALIFAFDLQSRNIIKKLLLHHVIGR
jgi:hypothetical protein